MQIIPLKQQVIVKKLELPKPKTFIPADSTLLGEVCRIIDMGPEGGDRGGTEIAKGTPEEVAQCEVSYTGQFLKEKLK